MHYHTMSDEDMYEVDHFATADYTCFGSDLAIRLKCLDFPDSSRQRWVIELDGEALGVNGYELWARGYTPLWASAEYAIFAQVRNLIENKHN